MYKNYTVAVIIPAYKTEKLVCSVVEGIPSWVDNIIVVDDCSPDNLSERILRLDREGLILLRHEKNQGVGGAMKTGFKQALELGVDLVVKMDSDAQMDPYYLPALLFPLTQGECDFTKGNRFHDMEALSSMPRIRKLGNIGLTFLNKLASGYWHIFDPQNGYIALKTQYLRLINVDDLSNDYSFENSLLCLLNSVEAKVADVFIPAIYDGEPSSLRIGRILSTFPLRLFRFFMKRSFLRYIYNDVSPVSIMGILGTVLLMFGGIFGARLWVRTLITGIATPLGTIMIALVPILIGFNLLLNAFNLDIVNSPKGATKGYRFTKKEIDKLTFQIEEL